MMQTSHVLLIKARRLFLVQYQGNSDIHQHVYDQGRACATYQALAEVGRTDCTAMRHVVVGPYPQGTTNKLGGIGDNLIKATL